MKGLHPHVAPGFLNPRFMVGAGIKLLYCPVFGHINLAARTAPSGHGTTGMTLEIDDLGSFGGVGIGRRQAKDTANNLQWAGLPTPASASGMTSVGIFVRKDQNATSQFAYDGGTQTGTPGLQVWSGWGAHSDIYGYYNGAAVGSTVSGVCTVGRPLMYIISTETLGANSRYYVKIVDLRTGLRVANQSGTATRTAAGTDTTWMIEGSYHYGHNFPGARHLFAKGVAFLEPNIADEWLRDPWGIFMKEPAANDDFVDSGAAPASNRRRRFFIGAAA